MDDLQENNIRTEEQKVKRLPLTSDYVFKRIFAREENNSMLKDFLESILNIHINKVEVKNPELTPNMADEKLGILDLKLDIDNERVVDVEMQVSNEHNIKERSSTYLSKLAAEQLKAKQPSDAVSADLHNSMIMQARFLRAIYYFDLVRMYGGVPLWTKSSIDRSEIMRPRATVDEVYTLITQDMEAALGLPTSWPNAQDKGRATSYAAQALLARIYLQWGKPEEALKYCRMLEGKFKLYDNLKDIFDPKNKNQEYENIFEIQFKHSGSWGLEGSIQHSYWGPRNVGGPTNFGGWGGFGPTQYLYDSYDNNDKRKKAFFITEYAGVTQTPPSSGKFWDAETGNVIEDDNLNFTMIRYADVLLMKAEALNSIDDTSNDKYDALNEVRGRAGLTSITAADNLNKEQFAEVVLEERLHELCCEHLRRWDLIRFGKLGEYMKDHAGVTIQPYHVLYPIPQAAVDANDAITENNEGY